MGHGLGMRRWKFPPRTEPAAALGAHNALGQRQTVEPQLLAWRMGNRAKNRAKTCMSPKDCPDAEA
ncbi:uncharacterized protein UV8b_04134 [Ustilaginoidea virens]|uniref:Uncharacterized protein n=1 Tax=Ustilaginoidea virens TaxID=1159556 RepID=A0A8E5MGV1_USTVR|nr:uncharacterized protein UV8b_04134 [Ustilaginoidea virens]QUC19893.1 hypothetical protein UV8b_04134 [Ustilaginoidea virens]